MKYVLQVRFNGADAAIGGLPKDKQQEVFGDFQAILNTPGILDGNQLQPIETATIVTIENGRTKVTHASAIDPSVTLDGYYLYDAADRDDAIELAARIPATRFGATVEIRPIVER